MRYLKDETTYILANFDTGDTVTIDVYRLSDNFKVVDGVSMTEIGTTGRFKYSFSQSISTKTEYLYICTNSIEEQQGKMVLGGYPDRLLTATEIRQCSVNDAAATTTIFITDLTETIDQFWLRTALVFTSGQNEGIMRKIHYYNGSTKAVTMYTPLPYAPANGDTFVIVAARNFRTNIDDNKAIADAVWDEPAADHVAVGSFGRLVKLIKNTADAIMGMVS